jgi:hypothetical protein
MIRTEERVVSELLMSGYIQKTKGWTLPSCHSAGSKAWGLLFYLSICLRLTDAEFVSEFLLGVFIVVFMKSDDSFTEVVREG